MAVATFTFNPNTFPFGIDNSQRRQRVFGGGIVPIAGPNSPPSVVNGVTIVGSSPSYVQGGNRINFATLESLKVGPPFLLPQVCYVQSLVGTGYVYFWNPCGPSITLLALTSNVITITAHNNLAAGDVVVLSGLTTNPTLNGIALTVIATGLSATAFEANLTHANITSAAETGFATPQTYASGLPFQGNLQIFQSAGTAAPLAELATGALPAGITGTSGSVNPDIIGWEAEFIRMN